MTNWHEEYRRRYARLKESGKPFFPFAVFKDAIAVFIVFCLLVFFAHHFGAKLEDMADPADTSYNPRPEWYFLFLFQALKLFPGKLEAVAAVLLPVTAVLVLFLMPFLDSGPERHIIDRKIWTGLGLASLIGLIGLTWVGFRSPLTNPAEYKNPKVMAGRRLFQDMKCAYCHKIGGKGGEVGPELDKVAAQESEEWLARHFRDPQAVTPGSIMPKLNLLDDEIQALVAYMKSLNQIEEPYTAEAPKLFAQNCATCHRIGQEGGEVGPDLSEIGVARDKAYIKRYVIDPSRVNAHSSMPSYKGQLTDVQIEDIARYLASLGR